MSEHHAPQATPQPSRYPQTLSRCPRFTFVISRRTSCALFPKDNDNIYNNIVYRGHSEVLNKNIYLYVRTTKIRRRAYGKCWLKKQKHNLRIIYSETRRKIFTQKKYDIVLCNRVGWGRRNPFNEHETQAQMRYDCNLKAVRAGERRSEREMFNFCHNWCPTVARDARWFTKKFILLRLTAIFSLSLASFARYHATELSIFPSFRPPPGRILQIDFNDSPEKPT